MAAAAPKLGEGGCFVDLFALLSCVLIFSIEPAEVEKDAIDGPLMIEYSAMIAAWLGEKDLACEQLAAAIRYPSSVSYGHLKLLSFWDPLRGDPRFEEIVASLAPK